MDLDEKCVTQIFGAIAKPDSSLPPGAGASRPMYLIVVSGGIPGDMLRLKKNGSVVGRSSESGVQLHDPSVSRRHASVTTDSKGNAWLTDLGSTNGTFLNGERLAPRGADTAAVDVEGPDGPQLRPRRQRDPAALAERVVP